MKRWSDSQLFIPLVSIAFMLLSGIATTGCGTGLTLVTAASTGQTNVVKDLLDKGANQSEKDSCGWAGWSVTALYCAAYGGHMETVKVLVDRGADVNALSHGQTPLTIAIFKGHTDIAKLLIDRGTDVNARSGDGLAPLTTAIDKDHADIAKLLIEKGADVEYALARYKKLKQSNRYELLEGLAKKQQLPKDRPSPPAAPTVLPLPPKRAEPF